MIELGVFFLILLSIGVGFYLGKKDFLSKPETQSRWTDRHYLTGLTQLLNDNSDEAIDGFVANMEVNSQTLETHMALGALLCRRGEFSRAVKVHQNLLERPGLNSEEIRLVQMELAIDYLRSGLLDRAEQLLSDFANHKSKSKAESHRALKNLLEVYEDTHEWKKAIDVADRLTERKFADEPDVWREKQSQYCCEIGGCEADFDSKRMWLKNALEYNPSNVRSALELASMSITENNLAEAKTLLKNTYTQNPDYLSESLALLEKVFHLEGDEEAFYTYLANLYDESPLLVVVLFQLKILPLVDQKEQRLAYLVRELARFKCTETSSRLLSLAADHSFILKRGFTRIHEILTESIDSCHRYQCCKCGFHGEQMHWLCPGCKSWSSIKYVER